MSCCNNSSSNQEGMLIVNKAREAAACAEANCASSFTNATNAATSATNAANSAAAAAASETNVENLWEDFQERYMGPHPSAPITTIEGALYWDTTANSLYVWDGTAWVALPTGFNEFTNFPLSFTTAIVATNLVQGQEYQIETIGSTPTNWVAIGALSATVGARFTKNATAATGNGTAKVTRDLNTRFADVVNVKDFGAVGDGVTDDTAAIQAAANAVNPSNTFNKGGVLFFEAGKRYKTTATINLMHGTIVEGNNAMITPINCDGLTIPNANPIISGIREIWFARCVINNLIIEGYGTGANVGYLSAKNLTYTGINLVDIGDVTITNCNFNFLHRGIWTTGCQQIYIERCKFYRCWLGIKTGKNPNTLPAPIGPSTQTDQHYIGKNLCDQCVYGFYINAFGANQGPITIENNYLFAPTTALANDGFFMRAGIIVEAARGAKVSNNTFDAYTVYNGYRANNANFTFVPDTACIVVDNNTDDAYLDFANIPILPAQLGSGLYATNAIEISDNAFRSFGWGVLVKRGLGVTIHTNSFSDLVSGGVKSFESFNSGNLTNNYWFNWQSLIPIPPEYTSLSTRWMISDPALNSEYRQGIGITPNKTLHVATGAGRFSNAIRVEPSTDTTFNSKRAGIEIGDWIPLQDGGGNGTKDFILYQSGGVGLTRLRAALSGNIGVGDVVPSSKLHVDGDITVSSATTATTATAGAQTLPANPVGFLVVNINGTSRKIPYYAT